MTAPTTPTQAAQMQELLDLRRQLVTVQLSMARELVQLRTDLRARNQPTK